MCTSRVTFSDLRSPMWIREPGELPGVDMGGWRAGPDLPGKGMRKFTVAAQGGLGGASSRGAGGVGLVQSGGCGRWGLR